VGWPQQGASLSTDESRMALWTDSHTAVGRGSFAGAIPLLFRSRRSHQPRTERFRGKFCVECLRMGRTQMFPLPLNRKHIASATCRGVVRKEIRGLNRLPIRAVHSHCMGDGPILSGMAKSSSVPTQSPRIGVVLGPCVLYVWAMTS
jgi:hypothetical protein